VQTFSTSDSSVAGCRLPQEDSNSAAKIVVAGIASSMDKRKRLVALKLIWLSKVTLSSKVALNLGAGRELSTRAAYYRKVVMDLCITIVLKRGNEAYLVRSSSFWTRQPRL